MAEANLFGIRGITGVTDTEASNIKSEGRSRERRKSSGCVDRELIGFWKGSSYW